MADAIRELITNDPTDNKTICHVTAAFEKKRANKAMEAGAGIAAMPPLMSEGAKSHPIAAPRVKAQATLLLGGDDSLRISFACVQRKTPGSSHAQIPSKPNNIHI